MQSERREYESARSGALSPTSDRPSEELRSASMTSSQARYGLTRSQAPSPPSDRQAQSFSASPTSISQLQGYIPGQGLAGAPDLTPAMRFPPRFNQPPQIDRPENHQPISYWTHNDGSTQPADAPAPPPSQFLGGAYNRRPAQNSYSHFPGTSPPARVSVEAMRYAGDERPRACPACKKLVRFTSWDDHKAVCKGQTIGNDAPGRWGGIHPMQKGYSRKDGKGEDPTGGDLI
jgi:hypothetical protein